MAWLVGYFYGMSTPVGLFNVAVSSFFLLQSVIWFQVTNDNSHFWIILASSNNA